MKNQQKEVLQNIRVEFDEWFSESTLTDHTDNILDFLKKHKLTYEKEGAIWFKTEQFGDDKDRVLVKSNGNKTYFLSDILYHKNKLERGFKKLINIWGADHHGYVKRVEAAIKALTTPIPHPLSQPAEQGELVEFKAIIGQLVSLYRDGQPVRLSKRTGEIITLAEVTEEIGADATRYFLARYSFDTPLDFDLSLAAQKSNENPVYYVQYAHARICSILRQLTPNPSLKREGSNNINLHPSERALILKLVRFPDELETISQNYTIHRLCGYAEELAKLFHNFYHECRVISDNEQTTANRLLIIKAVKTIISITLNLLGVSAPEKM
jgi:arginyl-tRNA synthetase